MAVFEIFYFVCTIALCSKKLSVQCAKVFTICLEDVHGQIWKGESIMY